MSIIAAFGLTGMLIIISGVLIRERKFYNLIAGYNTMEPEKKKTYNGEPLANKFGIFLYCIGIATIITGVVVYVFRYSKSAVGCISVSYAVIVFAAVLAFAAKETKDIHDL